MPVLKVKSLLLDFEVSGQVADGYRFTGVECDVKSVPVIGLKSVLASLNTITIPGESLNLDGARTNMVRTIDINEYLPVGVSLAGTGRHEINVTLTVEQLKERVYTVEVNDASFTGENDDYIYRAEPDTVNIRIEALAEELDSLTLDSADIQVDVSSMGEGIHEAKVVLKAGSGPGIQGPGYLLLQHPGDEGPRGNGKRTFIRHGGRDYGGDQYGSR